MKVNKFIDYIYPQSKLKDDSFTNTVLVTKESNAKKSDGMMPLSYQTPENKRFWRFLKEKDFITEEKYNRLIRTEEFTDDELSGFIARQLVETSQAIKAISSVLGELNPDTAICYSKAENTSAFRQNFGKIKEGNRKSKNTEQLVKVREINDYHHAKDAYLNIVVGNVYDVKFTRNAFNFIKNKNDARKYSLNNLFYEDVKNSNTTAWEMDKTIHTVEKVMNNNNILVTRRTAEKKGALYNATVYKAKRAKKDSYFALKTSDEKLLDVTKYGGYTSIGIAYYSIFEYTVLGKKGKQNVIRIVPIPIYISQNIKTDIDLVNYAREQLEKKEKTSVNDIKLRYRKLNISDLIKINNYPTYVGGKTNDYFFCDSAVQVVLDTRSERYIKEISKYLNWKKENKEGSIWESITKENNLVLYHILREKMNTSIFSKKKLNRYNELTNDEIVKYFKDLQIEEQSKVLLEILNVLTDKKTTYDLKLIKLTAARSLQNFDLSNLVQFSIIEQSITGFYEKEVKIIGE